MGLICGSYISAEYGIHWNKALGDDKMGKAVFSVGFLSVGLEC